MYERKMPVKKINGIDITFLVIGGKWKRDIIFCLNDGIKRPSELQRHLSGAGANSRVLRQQLKELETYKIIYKVIHTALPLKVEYYLTDLGQELIPLFEKLNEWGDKYEYINKDIVSVHGSIPETSRECLVG